MTAAPWVVGRGDDPILATAIHAGHDLRDDVGAFMVLPEDDRLREEDPFTDLWTSAAANTIAVSRSRFEVDMNRTRDKAVYRVPADAWGLAVWSAPPPDELVDASLALYDAFYADLGDLCDQLVEAHGRFVVLDLHSYNHRRGGPDDPVADPEDNPEVNLGTASIAPEWADVVAAFADAMARHPFDHGHLDVRENVKFTGGAMSRWINARYGTRGCSIAVELKKIYMDEWTGMLDEGVSGAVFDAITVAAEVLRERLRSSPGW